MGRGMVPCSSVRVVVGGGIHPCLQKHLFVEFLGRVVAHALLTVVHGGDFDDNGVGRQSADRRRKDLSA